MASRGWNTADHSDWGCDICGRDAAKRSITRRGFLKNGALALIGTSTIPAFLSRSVLGEMTTAAANKKKLVVLFQRGAVDGLNVVVPYREKNYYAMRPTIAIKQNEVIDLDGYFGLHPQMAAFKPLYDQGHLAIVHAAGSPDPSRSHFDAQDYMESGTPGVKVTEDGWLNRALAVEPAGLEAKPSAFRAVALGTQVPRTLQGKVPAIALNNLADFSVGGKGPQMSPISNAFQAMYDESSDAVLQGTGQETFEAVKMLKAADPAKYQPAEGAVYPNTPFGNSLKQIAQLMKANLGVEAAFSDIGGWDTHQNQGGVDWATGEPADRVLRLDCGLLAGHGNGRGERDAGDHVGVWPDGAAERDWRHRPWARECDVRAGRTGEGREGLREVAGRGDRAVERRPRPDRDHGLPQCAGRGGIQDAGRAQP